MNQKRFSGWEKYEGIQVIEYHGMKTVWLSGQPYMSWRVEDDASQRIAIVQLHRSGLGTQEKLAEIFQVHVNSVQNYIAAFARGGIKDLVNRQSGPREAWKITPEMKFKIIEVAFRNRDISYEQMVKVLKHRWGVGVSINSIRCVLSENGFIEERISKDDLWQQGDLFEGGNSKQLKMDFSGSEDLQVPFLSLSSLDREKRDCNDSYSKAKARASYSKAQRIYLDQLEQGLYSAYAGGLLFVPLLERYNFLPTIERVIDIETKGGFGLAELCLTLFYIDLFRIESMENFKTVYPEEFGLLMDKSFSPSVFTLRRFLNKVRESGKSEELIDEFAGEYFKSGLARWGVLYIDGHFLPYYGGYSISMGYHGVRKIPMKGSYNFLAVDEKYNPVLFLIRASSEDLLQKIPEIILKAKDAARRAGISEEEIENLTVVFDREGYSAELFRILDGKDSENKKYKARFITWAKYSDRWVNDIKDDKFDGRMTIDYEVRKSEELKYFKTHRMMNKYGKIRAIVIESGKDKRRAAIYVNDDEIEVDRIVQPICRRWGHENFIKEMMRKYLINYSPGYDAEKIEDQPMIDNPKVKELKQQRTNLKSEIAKIKSKFGDEVLEDMEKDAKWEEIRKKRILTIADIVSIRARINLLNIEIDKLPTEVRFDEAHSGKKLVELNYEKKRFLDCIKIFTYNMEKKMGELLSNYYDREKEIWPAVAMIVRRGAYVKLEHGKLRVQLRRFKNPEIDYAARHLCEDLNRMNPFTLDKFHLPIHYEVA